MTKTEYTLPGADGEQAKISVESLGDSGYRVTLDGETMELRARRVGAREYHLLHEGRSVNALVSGAGPEVLVHLDGEATAVQLLDERQAARLAADGGAGGRAADGTVAINAPMPGQVVKCLVAEGDAVHRGQGLVVVEAMKMENELRSSVDGTIKAFKVAEGDNVDAGECLLLIE